MDDLDETIRDELLRELLNRFMDSLDLIYPDD